jgi:GntR family transcriptional regulator
MNLQLDPHRRTPIYAQLVQHIKHQIASGQLKPGDRLPTVRALAAELQVHTNTVARAYDLLDQAGVISAQQGRGTFITNCTDQKHLQQQRRETLQTMIDQVILNALSLGYTHEEIEATFDLTLHNWKRKYKKGTR